MHTGGDAFRITNGSSDLVVTTLLPPEEGRIVRTIGGKWHDFEVDGVNDGPTEATYELMEKRKNGGLEGVGGWRIEVSPTDVVGEAHFLHVLRVGDAGKVEPVEASLVTEPDRSGARLTIDGKAYEVVFRTTGATGGHITASAGAQVVLDEPLVSSIEDNYGRWKDDPRYQAWMTNEFMHSVIFPGL